MKFFKIRKIDVNNSSSILRQAFPNYILGKTIWKFSLLIFGTLLFFLSCSSSTSSQRYSREKHEVENDSSGRFSSENDRETYLKEFDEEPIEDNPADVHKFVEENTLPLTSKATLSEKEKMMMEIVKYLNTPYKYGGNGSNGIDCSAFTQNVFSKSINFRLPRTVALQFAMGESVSKNQLRFGDLLFFDTTKNSYPGHVGIYLGNDMFAHASFSKGITISSLKSSYFSSRFVGARREVEIRDAK